MKLIKQSLEESNAYSLFVYAVRSKVTRDYYLRRLRIFFNYLGLNLMIQFKKDVILLPIKERMILVGHLIV
jgi:hypothetical protein